MIELVAALLAGLAIFVIILGLFGRPSIDPVQARLTSFAAGTGQTLEELELQRPIFDRTLRPLVGRATGVARRMASPSRVLKTERRLALAGNPSSMTSIDFFGLKIVLALIGFVATFLVVLVISRNPIGAALFGAVAAGFMYVATESWLGRAGDARQKAILLAVPDTLDLLTISVRAGLGFDGALARVVEKTKGPLAEEFGRALAEIRVGRARREALRDVVDRTNVQALATFIGAIIQAEQLGVPIAKVLQVQSEQLRIERRQRAEELAAKAPIRMLFPLVGCIFPSMFIVILGPAIILIIQSMGQVGN